MEKTRAISNNKKCLCYGNYILLIQIRKGVLVSIKGGCLQLEYGTSRRSRASIDRREVIVWKKKQRRY